MYNNMPLEELRKPLPERRIPQDFDTHYAHQKEIKVYAYNHHEGGGSHHYVEQIRFLKQLWK